MAATTQFNTYQPGKAPVLLDTTPAALTAYSRAARLFFRFFPEIHNWYLSSAEQHEAKKYEVFFLELQKRSLPRDYVWEAKGKLRMAKQGDKDYEDWVDELRTDHLALTDKVLSTRDFVESLLYGMDQELSSTLRQGTSLKNTGLHQDELDAVAFTTTTTVYPSSVDYESFDKEARSEWSKISSRCRSNAAQLRSLTKKTASLSVSVKPSSSSTPVVTSSARRAPSTSTSTNSGGSRPAKLTELEKDWLTATNGCFRCRQSHVGHEARDCTDWAPADFVVPVPPGWDRTKAVPNARPTPAVAGATAPVVVGVRALHAYDDDIELPEFLAEGSDSDVDGCAFPPLYLKLRGSKRQSRTAMALTDSGSSVTLISEQVAAELGLERLKLSRPKRCRVAIQGGEMVPITEFVRIPLELENGSWSAGTTCLLVAPVEEPFDIILGTPFLRQHRISLALDPDFQILVPQSNGLHSLDLLAPTYGPPTAMEAVMGEEDGEEKVRLVKDIAAACFEALEKEVKEMTAEEKEMGGRAAKLMDKFSDLFPSSLPPLTADYLRTTTTRHRIRLLDENKVHNQRGFNIPRKWRESWKRMLEEHLAAGRLRPSNSPFASAAFVVPKKDPTADPRWVNDYRRINDNTVKDRTPLPLPDIVLADAALAKVWGKIDMTNAFFQTPMAEEDIPKTAIKTPWGLFEWTVMPQGLCNAPATHQARVNEALRHLVGNS
ncbi:hypothetical protein JCM11641_000854 [Rhodosporidiobolus odoratus]